MRFDRAARFGPFMIAVSGSRAEDEENLLFNFELLLSSEASVELGRVWKAGKGKGLTQISGEIAARRATTREDADKDEDNDRIKVVRRGKRFAAAVCWFKFVVVCRVRQNKGADRIQGKSKRVLLIGPNF